jgi:hypothetical protein
MNIKKTAGTVILITMIAVHVSVRIMAKDAYLISTSDYQSAEVKSETPMTTAAFNVQTGRLLISGIGSSANAQQHPFPY